MLDQVDLLAARWALDLLCGSELPEIAGQALEAGFEGAAIRELAGECEPILSDVTPLFERVLVELDAPRLSREEAALIVARHHARAIVDGSVTPYEGARAIWREAWSCRDPTDHTLDPFVYWADEYEESTEPERTALCERAIRDSARELAGP